jgi:hypothetical protein
LLCIERGVDDSATGQSAKLVPVGRVGDASQVLDSQGTYGVVISTLPRCHRVLHADRDPIGNVVAVPEPRVRQCQRQSVDQASRLHSKTTDCGLFSLSQREGPAGAESAAQCETADLDGVITLLK